MSEESYVSEAALLKRALSSLSHRRDMTEILLKVTIVVYYVVLLKFCADRTSGSIVSEWGGKGGAGGGRGGRGGGNGRDGDFRLFNSTLNLR